MLRNCGCDFEVDSQGNSPYQQEWSITIGSCRLEITRQCQASLTAYLLIVAIGGSDSNPSSASGIILKRGDRHMVPGF